METIAIADATPGMRLGFGPDESNSFRVWAVRDNLARGTRTSLVLEDRDEHTGRRVILNHANSVRLYLFR